MTTVAAVVAAAVSAAVVAAVAAVATVANALETATKRCFPTLAHKFN